MAKNKKLETETKNNELENNENKQETTNMENNENKQETTNMENNENEQENTNMENNTNEQETNVNPNQNIIDTIVNMFVSEIDNTKYVMPNEYMTLQTNHSVLMDTVKTANNPIIANALQNEINSIEKQMAELQTTTKNNIVNAIISAICEKYAIRHTVTTKKNNTVNSDKTSNSNKYSYLDAIIDNIDTEWISPNELAKKIQNDGKLEQANSNPRFAGALANTLTNAVKIGKLDYDSTTHKYRLHVETLSNVAD